MNNRIEKIKESNANYRLIFMDYQHFLKYWNIINNGNFFNWNYNILIE